MIPLVQEPTHTKGHRGPDSYSGMRMRRLTVCFTVLSASQHHFIYITLMATVKRLGPLLSLSYRWED